MSEQPTQASRMESTHPLLTLARFGRTIRAARHYHGYTLRCVADLIGVKPERLRQWEQGRNEPPLRYLHALVVVLKLDPAVLFHPYRSRTVLPMSYEVHALTVKGDMLVIDWWSRKPRPDEQQRRDDLCRSLGNPTDADRAKVKAVDLRAGEQ